MKREEERENLEKISKMNGRQLYEYDLGRTYNDPNVADYVRNKSLYWHSGLQRHYDAMKNAENKYYNRGE